MPVVCLVFIIHAPFVWMFFPFSYMCGKRRRFASGKVDFFDGMYGIDRTGCRRVSALMPRYDEDVVLPKKTWTS
jgi:hypothetical protein